MGWIRKPNFHKVQGLSCECSDCVGTGGSSGRLCYSCCGTGRQICGPRRRTEKELAERVLRMGGRVLSRRNTADAFMPMYSRKSRYLPEFADGKRILVPQ